MASMSVSGIVSGMDWEGMIDEIITNAAKPAQVKVNKKTNLTNKKSLFEEMKVTMNSLQSSLSPLKLPSTYKAKTIDIERIDKNTSYKGVLTATANADAEVNVWDLTVNQLATAQINRSKQINDSNLTSTLNGVSGKTIYINAGGQKVGVEVKSSDTLESLKSRINTTLKTLESPIYVTASVVDNKLLLKSDYTGLGTMTGRETINYNYSTGINRLSNLSIPEEAYDNVKITSSGRSYTIHKDFEIANGNEIRWKQYDRGNEVALGDTATVTYTMAGSDVYTKTGTYRTSEASVTGFSVKDMGTLANRLKIKAGTDTYSYGKDFTLDTSGKVKWLEAAAPTTNEPSSYTVSYTNTVQKAYTASGDKISPMKVPASYTVSYDKVMQADVSVNLTGVDLNANASGNFPTYEKLKSVYGLNDIAGNNQNKLDFNGSSADKVEIVIGGSVDSSYSYGTDFTIKKASYGPLNPLSGTSNAAISWEQSTVSKPSGSYSVRYTHTYDATAGDGTYDADLAEIISEAGANTGNIKITGADGTEYVNGVHFKIENGGITWKITEEVIDVDDTEFAELQTKYAEATGSELATKTLIDGNGVLRTYVNPEDTSLFTMSVGGVDYEYGRDYVLRVNDAGTGYLFDWLVDDGNSIADANTSVAKYAAYRNINTSSWKAAPTDGTAYNFGFNYNYASTSEGTVSKTSTDKKSLSSILPGVTVSDYSQLVISDGTKIYAYNTDWKIDDSGNITWIEQSSSTYTPQYPEGAYTLTYEAFDAIESTYTYSPAGNDVSINVGSGNGNIGGNKLSYEQILKYVDIAPTSETPQSKIDGSMEKYFTLTDDTKTYTYGTDYRIIKGTTQDSDSSEYQPMIEWISGGLRPSGNFKLTYGTDGGETISTSVTRDASDTLSVAYNDIKSSTVTITQGSKTYYEGIDFNLSGDSSNVVVTWISDKKGGCEWYYPNPGSSYTLNVENSNGTKTTYSGRRTSSASLNFMSDDYGMTKAGGSISVHYGDDDDHSYRLDAGADSETGYTGYDVIKGTYGIDITPTTGGTYTFNWVTPKLTTHSNLPSMNDELTVEYQYDANTFDLSDDGDGDLLYALGFTKSDGNYDDYTAAKNAILDVDGEEVERDSNDIGESYENELIKGVTLHLKGTGEVTMDISHDAEKAVESIQSFVDNYNDLMTWMNTRMTEKQLDEDTAATVDSDDFRMRWGLLHGNSLLRQTKSQMRSLTSKNFTFTFTQRKSSEEIYGSMAFNGLKTASTLRLRIGSKYVDITIDPSDTLETIVAKLSDDTKNGPMHDFYYDENGQKLQSPLIKASVENDKLEIHSTDNQEITMSGSAAMNALKMNYTYKGLYQIGIESTSDDYGKSGELVFDTDEFMTALEDNPDEVQALMTSFVSEFSAWTSSMLSTSASGETKGTLTREIDNIQSQIDTINEYLERYQERLDRMEENLRTRYGNTETQFSKLSQQANSIAAILNQLNGTASGGGYGQASS